MTPRLATQIHQQLPALVDQYDAQLRNVPGYASLSEPARRNLEEQILKLMADCLETDDDNALIQYIHARAEQVLSQGFQPEWFHQAVMLAQEIIAPLIEKVDEGNFVWRAMNRAQAAAWQIVARERQRIELTLRESEARYQTIFDSTPIMFWLKDTHNRTLRINRAAADLEGVKPADVEGKSAYELYPQDQAEAFYQDDLAVINSGQPKLGIIEEHTSVGTGELMWLETGKTPVHDDRGATIGVLVFAVDITTRRQAEDILQQSADLQQRAARYLRTAIEAMNELIRVQDLETLHRRAVELAREKFGIERCGLYLIDETRQYLQGTYGTDDLRQTTDERNAQRIASEFETILSADSKQLWVVRETPHIFFRNGVEHTVGTGWVVCTVLRGAAGPIGILFNDNAISGQPVDETQQEALAVYCSAVGSIIERKRLEGQIQASFTQRGIQIQTSTEVAQEIAVATDLNELFQRVVTLIKERFNYYHVQLFRYEPKQDAVVLITGYGEVGRAMLAAGHRLPMGRGVVGSAAATGASILAADVRQDTDWRPNPNLPETRGELAVPIKLRGQVLGILDVQSAQVNTLTEDDRLLLEGLCGQIAIVIESTRLLDSAQQSERELAKFKLGLERSNAAVFITNPQGVISYVNPAFEKIYGYSSEEARGQTPRLIKSGVIPPEQYKHFWSTLLSKQTVAGEIINRAKDGRLIPVDGSNNPILNDAGEIVGFLAIHNDISARKHTDEELARSAQLLNTIINTSRDLIYIKNTKSEFLVASQAVARLAGAQSSDELIGKSDFDFFSHELAQKYYTDEQNIMQTGEPLIDVEEPTLHPDGTQAWLLTTKIPYRAADGTLLGILGIGRDITERKHAEQRMEETLRETERLYAAVSAEGWKTYRQSGHMPDSYLFDRTLLQPANQLWEPEMALAVGEERTVATHSAERAVAVTPLAVRGKVIGALGVYDDPDQPLPPEDVALIEAISEQVALALESARLFDQTQQDAQRERTINRITGHIRSARSVEEVLAVATQELRLATQASRSMVEIKPARTGNGEGAKA